MIHTIAVALQIVAVAGCVSSAIYYFIGCWCAAAFLRSRRAGADSRSIAVLPPISILKPLKGTDPHIYESFRSHCLQDYPEYEIIFGVSHPLDPAVASVERLQREFPQRKIRLLVCPEILGPNVKVSNLEQMARAARYDFFLINDSDIRVERDYLRRIIAPFSDNQVGMVTCLYRGIAAATVGSRLEALGISTDFCAGVLVAQRLEHGLHFALGSTLAFRRRDLEQIGGFKALVDFLADDYELGRRISGQNKKVVLSGVVVETHLPAYDLREFLDHQLRWFRGIRDARRTGYIGLISTFGIMWALLALISARAAPWSWAVLGAMLLLRAGVALLMGTAVLHDQQTLSQLWLLPLRDLIAAAVWTVSFAGNTVTWRGDRFQLKNGMLIRLPHKKPQGGETI